MSIFYSFMLGFAGFIIGFIGTFVGIGGGILLLLLFIFLFATGEYGSYDIVRLCIANTAFVLAGMHLVTLLRKWMEGRLYLRDTLTVMVPTLVVGGMISYLLLHGDWFSISSYRIVLILFIAYTCYVLLIYRVRKPFEMCRKGGVQSNLRNLVAGSFSGFFTALLGVESAALIVPLLNRYCHIDIRQAVSIYGTSFLPLLALMGIMYGMATAPVTGDAFTGYIFWPYVLPLFSGASLASFVGYELFNRFQFQYFVYPLVFFLALTALRMLFSDILSPLYR